MSLRPTATPTVRIEANGCDVHIIMGVETEEWAATLAERLVEQLESGSLMLMFEAQHRAEFLN
jgi:hypothetical protein